MGNKTFNLCFIKISLATGCYVGKGSSVLVLFTFWSQEICLWGYTLCKVEFSMSATRHQLPFSCMLIAVTTKYISRYCQVSPEGLKKNLQDENVSSVGTKVETGTPVQTLSLWPT